MALGVALLAVLAPTLAVAAPAQDDDATDATAGSRPDDPQSNPSTTGSDADATAGDPGFVTVIEVSGLLDRVLADFVEREIDRATDQGAIALVLQLDSGGALVGDDRLADLAAAVEGSPVPVDVWIGPSGSRALGGATRLVATARSVGLSPGSRVELTRELLAARGDDSADGVGLGDGRAAVGDRIDAPTALELGVIDSDAPVIGDFVVDLDGVQTEVVERGDERRRRPVTRVRFAQLPLLGQLMHTVASPAVAYLLLAIGLGLLLFEFYTAGIGIAGVVGAGSLVLAAYGLAELPTRPGALALIALAMFGYAVDVQTGVPRLWSGIATVAFVIGSVLLYDGPSMSWITLLVGVVGMSLAMIAGMPAMVRTRFSTPTIGREWMVGEEGVALGAVSPDGIVAVRDAPWRAHTHRATPIGEGDPVRVVAIDGLVLEVEPRDGGARDHRERRGTD